MSPANQKIGKARGEGNHPRVSKMSKRGIMQTESSQKQVSVTLGERTEVTLYKTLDKFIIFRVARIYKMKMMIFYFPRGRGLFLRTLLNLRLCESFSM